MKSRSVIFLIPLFLLGCTNTDPQQLREKLIGGNKQERIIPVGVQSIDSVGGIVRNSYPGNLEEGQSVDMAFKYGGVIERINVKEGSNVRKGQVLARVSSPSMESTLRSAQATLDQAQDAYDRLKKVYDNGSLPEIKWKEMVANLEKAHAAVDLANAMLMENVLTAPFNGTVASLNAEIGENATPLKPIMRIISTKGITVKISVPENEIHQLAMGDEADIIIPALDERHFHGKIVEKSMTASLITHSYPVKVLIEDPDKELYPGMIARVVFRNEVNKGIVIPANAVLINSEGKFVWVEENGQATRRSIVISGYSGEGVIISQGLHTGDKVIVEGYQKISEGMKVSTTEKDQ